MNSVQSSFDTTLFRYHRPFNVHVLQAGSIVVLDCLQSDPHRGSFRQASRNASSRSDRHQRVRYERRFEAPRLHPESIALHIEQLRTSHIHLRLHSSTLGLPVDRDLMVLRSMLLHVSHLECVPIHVGFDTSPSE